MAFTYAAMRPHAKVTRAIGTRWKDLGWVHSYQFPDDETDAFESDGGLRVIVSAFSQHEDLVGVWHHLSVSRRSTIPCYSEMMAVKGVFLPDVMCIQIHPPAGSHINIHPYCLHLWARVDQPAAPDFGAIFGMI